MTEAIVEFRDPWPPHALLGSTKVNRLRYGFVLNAPGTAYFGLSRGSAQAEANPQHFDVGTMVTIVRTDEVLPWVGYVSEIDMDVADPEWSYSCEDVAGALFDQARTAKDWPERTTTAGTLIRDVFADAAARAEPPLIAELAQDIGLGPRVAYTVKAESLLGFLQHMAQLTNWEWGLRNEVAGGAVRVVLTWAERQGFDRRDETHWLQNRHFAVARLTKSAKGYLSSALAVGGAGSFAARPAAQLNATGRADGGIDAQSSGLGRPASPALAGTRVSLHQDATNVEALFNAARRSLDRPPEQIAERLTLKLAESAIDMTKLELGSYYTVRFSDLNLGLGYSRVIRVMGIALDQSGAVEIVPEVQRA